MISGCFFSLYEIVSCTLLFVNMDRVLTIVIDFGFACENRHYRTKGGINMGLRDEILKINEERETAMKDALARQQDERKSKYYAEIQQAISDITNCIFNAFKNARIAESYTVKKRHEYTIKRKNTAIRMAINVKLHKQYQSSIVFKSEYRTEGDDYDTWHIFDKYVLHADISAYTLIMNGVIENLENEGIAECFVEAVSNFYDGFQYIQLIKGFSLKWKRIREEDIQRVWGDNADEYRITSLNGNDIVEHRKDKERNHWTTISMILFFS